MFPLFLHRLLGNLLNLIANTGNELDKNQPPMITVTVSVNLTLEAQKLLTRTWVTVALPFSVSNTEEVYNRDPDLDLHDESCPVLERSC